MSFERFVEWTATQPGRHELIGGVPLAMAPERAAHVRMKARVHRALEDAIAAAGHSCEAFIDGLTVRVDDETAYEPDVVVHCGPPVRGDAITVSHPVVVVEVLSPSSRGRDTGAKLADYFRVPTIRHYLLVHTDRSTVIHHARRSDTEIATRILTEGTLTLDPPGLELALPFHSSPR